MDGCPGPCSMASPGIKVSVSCFEEGASELSSLQTPVKGQSRFPSDLLFFAVLNMSFVFIFSLELQPLAGESGFVLTHTQSLHHCSRGS